MEDSQPTKKPMRPFGVKKRYSLGALLAMGMGAIYWLQGFAPVCVFLPEGTFRRALCDSITSSGRPLPRVDAAEQGDAGQ